MQRWTLGSAWRLVKCFRSSIWLPTLYISLIGLHQVARASVHFVSSAFLPYLLMLSVDELDATSICCEGYGAHVCPRFLCDTCSCNCRLDLRSCCTWSVDELVLVHCCIPTMPTLLRPKLVSLALRRHDSFIHSGIGNKMAESTRLNRLLFLVPCPDAREVSCTQRASEKSEVVPADVIQSRDHKIMPCSAATVLYNLPLSQPILRTRHIYKETFACHTRNQN
ncbi:hypothetical protein EJ03DRAFT_61930 [Teratosphaeria nubilosa]|uniref:Uncharacterized protein n=1 Tax=Teratosphaeria nubilosa TaxID=161662 RepID=A0A6G1LCP8_9PEZI|nr:hypothetical protein EJ03DRAFT_61930 [Teratosphaeria nubilosa]